MGKASNKGATTSAPETAEALLKVAEKAYTSQRNAGYGGAYNGPAGIRQQARRQVYASVAMTAVEMVMQEVIPVLKEAKVGRAVVRKVEEAARKLGVDLAEVAVSPIKVPAVAVLPAPEDFENPLGGGEDEETDEEETD